MFRQVRLLPWMTALCFAATGADFILFPNKHPLPDKFKNGSFEFMKLGGKADLTVVASGAVKGLQFPNDGMEVKLPTEVAVAELSLGTFSTEVEIEVLDRDGKVIHTNKVPTSNKLQPVTLNPPAGKGKISALRFTKGGGEGNLASICIKLAVIP